MYIILFVYFVYTKDEKIFKDQTKRTNAANGYEQLKTKQSSFKRKQNLIFGELILLIL